MSYGKAKEEADRKRRKIIYILFAVALFLAAGLCVFSAFYPASTWKYYVKLPKLSKRAEGELRIHFLDVGQGDCTLLELPDGRSLIIDGGDGSETHTAAILRYMNALKIKRPDFMLLTHPDSDHSGGMDRILEVKGADTVYIPGIEFPNVNAEYAAFRASLSKSDSRSVVSRRYLQILSSDERYPYALTFLAPYREDNPDGIYNKINGGDYTEADLNDSSAVVWLDYSGTSALFCGDATSKAEGEILRDYRLGFFDGYGVKLDSTEILKVSHHGSRYSTNEEFADFLGVKTAVISCGRENPYGHPASEVCDNLTGAGAKIYRTDMSGNVVIAIASDGSYRVETQYGDL